MKRLAGIRKSKSEQMARVRSKDSAPERMVRKLLALNGVRYRLHRRDLPGTPDVFVPRLRLAVFVHGCFWHGHEGCSRASLPKTNVDFWKNKLIGNMERDKRVKEAITKRNLEYSVIWACDKTAIIHACEAIGARYHDREKGVVHIGSS
jgi:DNA mismatch endonuclease (patch repair protein)